jgi:hypothetical protein
MRSRVKLPLSPLLRISSVVSRYPYGSEATHEANAPARHLPAVRWGLLWRSVSTRVISMNSNSEDRSRYTIKGSHRNQAFVGVIRRDPDTYCWTWKGRVDFDNGHNITFSSQRSFNTKLEAEDYMRRFAHDRIDSRLNF